MSQEQFIKEFAGYVQKYAPLYGITVHSPIIAQGILESASGTSNKVKVMRADGSIEWRHNYLGLKWRNNRLQVTNEYFVEGTAEQNKDGTYNNIEDRFFKFNSMEECVIGYFQFINNSNYANLKGVTDPYQYLVNIKADGYATSLEYVNNVYNVIKKYNLTQYDKMEVNEMAYTNSPLVDCKVMSPNHSGERVHNISRITPHCVVGQLTAESIGGCFTNPSREASCNYGIGKDGRVCLIVDEANRSWCSSNRDNDQRAITIECASDKTAPYAMNDAVYGKLVELCTDICKRNGKKKLLWFGNKDEALNHIPAFDEMIITVHRWFSNKSCPGDWLYNRLGALATEVTKRLNGNVEVAKKEPETGTKVLYRVQIGAYSVKANAEAQLARAKAAGFKDAIITTTTVTK